jgi:general L-amino acid transport system substrate-binding protein
VTNKKQRLWRALALLFAVTLIAASCGDDEDDAEVTAEPTEAAAPDPDATEPAETTTTVEDVVDDTQDGDLLDTVLARGDLNCGVSGSAVAFSETQPDGSQTGFDADYCRAVAAALFGDAGAVVFTPLTAAERFTAVQTGEVDVLMRNTTWTQSRDTEVGMDFGPTTYYDGQQLMARESAGFSGASQVADIAGAIVCTNAGTTTEQNIADAADAAGIEMRLTTFEDFDQVTENFINGACDVITTDGSALVGRKANQQPAGENWVIFPATPISKEPLGPTYGQNQSRFADVVNWTVYATIIADEKGITSDNVDDMAASPPDAEAARLLGAADDEQQSNMDLAPDAFYQVIAQVGNYDEIYARHLNPVGLTREGSANAGWLDGGLIYAPPAR